MIRRSSCVTCHSLSQIAFSRATKSSFVRVDAKRPSDGSDDVKPHREELTGCDAVEAIVTNSNSTSCTKQRVLSSAPREMSIRA